MWTVTSSLLNFLSATMSPEGKVEGERRWRRGEVGRSSEEEGKR